MSRHDVPPDWADLPPLRWGIVGAGRIAGQFTEALAALPGGVVAVTARDRARVEAFASHHDIPGRYTSVEDLLGDDALDAVYVATPHSWHDQPVIAALASGRPVLCEKPLTHSLEATRRCVEAAAGSGVLLLEAMWTRFLPAMATAAAWIAEGAIGELRTLRASIGFTAPDDPDGRLLSPALAGGALLDVGVYPLALARWAFGDADVEDLAMAWQPTATGVDGQVAMVLRFAGGGLADLAASLVSHADGSAWLGGTEGAIELPTFHKAQEVRLHQGRELVRTVHHPHHINGLEHQAAAFASAVAQGWAEHPMMPLRDSLAVAGWSQQIRDRMGITFPFEAPPAATPPGAAFPSGADS